MPGRSARVLILADCAPEVGGGHVMRCLALAQALTVSGAACAFAASPDVARVLEAFAPREIERCAIGAADLPRTLDAAAAAAEAWRATAVVVDHYRLAFRQEGLLRRAGARIVCIDDLADRRHDCDLLVDPTLGRMEQAYASLVPPGCRVLAGPDFALLRPDYAEAREGALARRRPAGPPRRLLVSMGLMDHQGITGRVLNLIRPVLGELEVDIAVGAQATSLTFIEHVARQDPRLHLHVDARDMAGLIAEADIGVGAGGASSWERAALGLPALTVVLAANQQTPARELDRHGATIAVDSRDKSFGEALPAALERLMGDAALRESLSQSSAALCDGRGAGRVAEAVLALPA
jgi:UDP-2,4-diacetamido-2,4,6-trideoxy-beta-L-altropyranose hydrolase